MSFFFFFNLVALVALAYSSQLNLSSYRKDRFISLLQIVCFFAVSSPQREMRQQRDSFSLSGSGW